MRHESLAAANVVIIGDSRSQRANRMLEELAAKLVVKFARDKADKEIEHIVAIILPDDTSNWQRRLAAFCMREKLSKLLSEPVYAMLRNHATRTYASVNIYTEAPFAKFFAGPFYGSSFIIEMVPDGDRKLITNLSGIYRPDSKTIRLLQYRRQTISVPIPERQFFLRRQAALASMG